MKMRINSLVRILLICSIVIGAAVLAFGAPFGEGNKLVTFYNIGTLKYDPGTKWNVERFVGRNPDFKVNVLEVPWTQYKSKYFSAMMTGATDMGEMWYPWVSDFVDKGLLEPLDDIVTDKEFSRYPTSIQNFIKFPDGHIYVVPHYMNVDGFYYNQSMLKKAGLDGPPANWDELVEYAKKLTKDFDGDGNIDQWGLVFPFKRPTDLLLRYLDFLKPAGGTVFDSEGNPQINSAEAVKTLEFLTSLRNKYHVIPEGITSLEPSDASRLFYTGKAAMMINFASELPRVLDPKVSDVVKDVKLTTLPVGPGGNNSNIATVIWLAVSAAGKNKDNAKKLVDYLTSWQAQQDEMIHEPGNVVAYPDVVNSRRVKENVPFSEVVSRLVSNSTLWIFPEHSKVEEILEAQIELAMLGKKSPKQALDSAQKKLLQLVK